MRAKFLWVLSFVAVQNPLDLVGSDYKDFFAINTLPLPFEQGVAYFKSPVEVDHYFLSQVDASRYEKAYLKKYKPLILSVSQIFQVPFSFQSCLIHRESRFDPLAQSHMGALGVAQFTTETFSFLKRALKVGAGKKQVGVLEEALKQKSEFEFKQALYADLFHLWTRYLEENNLDKNYVYEHSYRQVLTQPDYALGLSGLYLYYLKKRLHYVLKKVHKYPVAGLHLNPDVFLALAGAYNQGAKRLLKVASYAKVHPKKWVRYQSKIKETRDYIKYIKSCMKSKSPIHSI